MTEEAVAVEFPQYAPPQGIPVADPKAGAPLMKMAKTLLKAHHPKMALKPKTKPKPKKNWY